MTVESFANLVGNDPVAGDSARPNINPSDLSDVIGEFAQASKSQTRSAIAAAREAFPSWSRSSPQVRADILDRAASLIAERSGDLASPRPSFTTGANLTVDGGLTQSVHFTRT